MVDFVVMMLFAAEEPATVPLRPFLAVLASVLVFILLVERAGILATTVIAMLTAYAGQEEGRYGFFLVFAVSFAALVWLTFSIGFGLPLRATGRLF